MSAGLRGLRRAWQCLSRQPQSLDERNARLLFEDIAWFGIVNGISATFTSVFAVRLGASNQLVGLLVSLPPLVMACGGMAAARLVERARHRMRLLVASLLLNRLGYLAIASVPLLFASWRPQALVAVVGLMAVPATVGILSFNTMMADVVSPEQRARVVSIRFLLIYLTTTFTVLITGRMLDVFPFPANYQGAFVVAFLGSLMSLAALARIRIPGAGAARPASDTKPIPWRSVLAHPRFRGFALTSFAVNLALFAPTALFSLFRVRTLGASDTWIGLLGTVETAVAIFSSYLWGRQSARRGDRQVLLIAMLGLTAYPLLTALSPRVEPLLFVSVIGGLFAPAYNIAIFNLLLATCPQEGRPAYMAVYNMLLNLATFAAPLAGTALADCFDIRTALLLTGGLRLAAAAAVAWWARSEGSPAPAMQAQAS